LREPPLTASKDKLPFTATSPDSLQLGQLPGGMQRLSSVAVGSLRTLVGAPADAALETVELLLVWWTPG
jgi:hypothetical protein